jgi:DNA-binding NarL/FixJ family response regulator
VVIIDDHELFSSTLSMALRGEDLDASTVPVAQVQDFLRRPAADPGGLVVLDLDLSRDARGRAVNGADLVERLQARGWKALVVTGSGDRPAIARAVAAGAVGYLPKSCSFTVLVRTVLAAVRGASVMTEAERQDWRDRHDQYRAQERELSRRLSRLTPRERDVLDLLGTGTRAAAIAERFVVTLPTVRTQIRSILSKLEVGSQLEAVALLRQLRVPNEVTMRDE